MKDSVACLRLARALWWRRAMALALALSVCLLGASAVWARTLKDRFIPKRFGVVVPGEIFRSGQMSSPLVEKVLREHHIKVIVDLNGDHTGLDGIEAEQRAVRDLGIDYECYPLNGDGTGDIRQYARALERIQQATALGEPVLVHCAAGVQRTGGVVATYRLLIQHRTSASALAEMKHYGWRPTHDAILRQYVNAHMRELVDLLVTDGVIAEPPDPLPQLPK